MLMVVATYINFTHKEWVFKKKKKKKKIYS